MVISQTCDLQVREKAGTQEFPQFVSVAALLEIHKVDPKLAKFSDGATPFGSELKPYSKMSDRPNHFYLPAFQGPGFKLVRSLACLLMVQTLSGDDFFPSLSKLPRLRLSSEALGLVQQRLSHQFGRFAASDELLRFEDVAHTSLS